MSKDNKINLLPTFGGNRAGAEGMWLEMVSAVREMNKVMDTHTIYVLADGETYSGAPCVGLSVNEEELERIESGEKIYNVVPDWATRGE